MLAGTATADAVVMAAAPADYRPSEVSGTKIKKADDGSAPSLALEQNPDILAEISHDRVRPGAVVVGFAAETGDAQTSVLEMATAKLARKGCDLLVVNDVSGGTGVRQHRERGRRARRDRGAAARPARLQVGARARRLGPGRGPVRDRAEA